MAFGLKYTLPLKTVKGNLYTAKVYFDGYAGAEIDRNLPLDSPFVLRKDKAAVIRGTSFEFAIREAVDFEFLEFYTNSQKKIKVELYNPSDDLIWVGYNLPQQYQVPYIPSPVSVRFTASDGLGLLKNEAFTLTGLNTPLTIIRHCIDKIGLTLGYSIAVNVFETTHNESLTSLDQAYLESVIPDGSNCYEVLEKVLTLFNAEITQCRGRWQITCRADKKSTRMLYTSAGVYEDTEAAPATLDLGMPGASGIEVNPVGQLGLSLEPGGRSVTLVHDYGRKNSLLNNGDFSEDFTDWTQTGTYDKYVRYDKDGKRYAFLEGYNNSDEYIEKSIPVVTGSGYDFVMEFNFSPLGYIQSSVNRYPTMMKMRYLVCIVDSGDNYKYLTPSGWSDTLTINEVEVSSGIGDPIWNKLRVITTDVPMTGDLYVQLYRYKSAYTSHIITGMAFQEINAYFLVNSQPYPAGITTGASFSNSSEPGDLGTINMIAGDAPSFLNAGNIFRNIFRQSDGTPTTVWHRLGDTNEFTLREMLGLILASENRVAKQKLTGTIRGTSISFDSIIKHTYNSNREFEIAEGSWDIYNEAFNVTLLELLAWSDETVVFTSESSQTPLSGSSSSVFTGGGTYSGNAAGETSEDILAKIKEVDGADSGLDADLLDGMQGNQYAPIDSPNFLGSVSANEFIVATGLTGKGVKFSDGDTGLVEYTDDNLRLYTNNVYYTITQYGINTNTGSAFYLSKSTSSNTVPTLVPHANSKKTGIGGVSDTISLICNESEIAHIAPEGVGIGAAPIYSKLDIKSVIGETIACLAFGTMDGTYNPRIILSHFASAVKQYLLFDSLFGSGSGYADFYFDHGALQHPDFVTGFTGSNWKITEAGDAEFQNMIVRGSMSIYELIINQIRATNGSMWVTDSAKLSSVDSNKCYVDTDGGNVLQPFAVNDVIRCQKWNGRGVKYYTATVDSVDASGEWFTFTVIDGTDAPAAGDIVVRVGNTTDTTRQGSLFLTSSESNSPYMDVMDGVTDETFSGKTKVRIGKLSGITDADFGALSGYGLYADVAYLKGSIMATAGEIGALKIDSDSIYTGTKHGSAPTYSPFTTAGLTLKSDGSIRTTTFYVDENGDVGIKTEQPHWVPKVASNNVRNSHDSEQTTDSTDFAILKGIVFSNGLKGTHRYQFKAYVTDMGYPGSIMLCKNGVQIGSQASIIGDSYGVNPYTQDITVTWEPDEELQLYAKSSKGDVTLYVKEFRVLYDDGATDVIAVKSYNSTPK